MKPGVGVKAYAPNRPSVSILSRSKEPERLVSVAI